MILYNTVTWTFFQIGNHAQLKHFPNRSKKHACFNIDKTVKHPDKKPVISDSGRLSVFLYSVITICLAETLFLKRF